MGLSVSHTGISLPRLHPQKQIRMRQKHRKAIYLILASIMAVIFFPIWLIASVSTWISNKVIDWCDILKYLLRIYDEDNTKTDTK